MTTTLKTPTIFLCMLTLLMISCKKDSKDDIQYSVTIVPLQALGFSNVPSAIMGQFFVRQLPAAGGKPPYTWKVSSGTLPPGLSLESNGRVSGTPGSTGEFTYTLELKDSKGTTVKTKYTQKIATSGTVDFMILAPQIPEFGKDQDVGYLSFAQGGTLPWVFTITGLPAGVNYDSGTGLIHGTPTSASAGIITITLKDALGNEASGSPVTTTFKVNPPEESGGGEITGCPSVYDGNYIGEFKYVYYVKGQDGTYSPVEGGFQLSVTLKCLATAGGSSVLNITKANCSDPNFSCQVGGCVPVSPSVANLPAEPPANSSNPSASGQGIILFFPNGSAIVTNNGPGGMNVTTSGRILSNSLDPAYQNNTWTASGGDFPSGSIPPGGPVTKFLSWNLVWSATK